LKVDYFKEPTLVAIVNPFCRLYFRKTTTLKEATMLKEKNDIQTKLMVLWIFVKLNVISADILGFLQPGFLKELTTSGTAEGLVITPGFLMIAAVLLEVNLIMILVSKFLPRKLSRILNIIAPVIVAAFIIGGGSLAPHYIFFASIEVIALIFIMKTAIQWKESV
jgi:hypothetical protein